MKEPLICIDKNTPWASSVLCFDNYEELTGSIVELQIFDDRIIAKQAIRNLDGSIVKDDNGAVTENIEISFIYIDDGFAIYDHIPDVIKLLIGREDVKWSSISRASLNKNLE